MKCLLVSKLAKQENLLVFLFELRSYTIRKFRQQFLYSYSLVFVIASLVLSCAPLDDKLVQYKRQGEELYVKHCSNCHQTNGQGLGLVYPPVDVSDFVDNNLEKTICLIKHGVSGEMLVNGKSFNKPMPGIRTLTNLEVAEIATYLYNNWGRSKGVVEVSDVSNVLDNCTPYE